MMTAKVMDSRYSRFKMPSHSNQYYSAEIGPTDTAVQWIQTYKTANSTAYSTANTQPTAWDLFTFILWWRGRLFYCLLWVVIVFYYDLGILVSTRDEAATSSFHLSECSENHETPLSTILTVNPTAWLSHFVYRPWVWIPVIAVHDLFTIKVDLAQRIGGNVFLSLTRQ